MCEGCGCEEVPAVTVTETIGKVNVKMEFNTVEDFLAYKEFEVESFWKKEETPTGSWSNGVWTQ